MVRQTQKIKTEDPLISDTDGSPERTGQWAWEPGMYCIELYIHRYVRCVSSPIPTRGNLISNLKIFSTPTHRCLLWKFSPPPAHPHQLMSPLKIFSICCWMINQISSSYVYISYQKWLCAWVCLSVIEIINCYKTVNIGLECIGYLYVTGPLQCKTCM